MATLVLELACLRLLPGIEVSSQDLIGNLKKAKETMEAASKTGLAFHFFSCIEDSSLIFLLGAWQSVKQHMEEFIPSDANQNLLQLVKNLLSVEWMFHVDLVDPGFARYHELLQQPVAVFDRRVFKLTDDELHNSDKAQKAIEYHMKTHIAEKERHMCGWREDWNAEERISELMDEYVVISGWKTMEQYQKDLNLEHTRYGVRWLDYVSRLEARAAVLIKLEDVTT
jgi:hypothetical protein